MVIFHFCRTSETNGFLPLVSGLTEPWPSPWRAGIFAWPGDVLGGDAREVDKTRQAPEQRLCAFPRAFQARPSVNGETGTWTGPCGRAVGRAWARPLRRPSPAGPAPAGLPDPPRSRPHSSHTERRTGAGPCTTDGLGHRVRRRSISQAGPARAGLHVLTYRGPAALKGFVSSFFTPRTAGAGSAECQIGDLLSDHRARCLAATLPLPAGPGARGRAGEWVSGGGPGGRQEPCPGSRVIAFIQGHPSL